MNLDKYFFTLFVYQSRYGHLLVV